MYPQHVARKTASTLIDHILAQSDDERMLSECIEIFKMTLLRPEGQYKKDELPHHQESKLVYHQHNMNVIFQPHEKCAERILIFVDFLSDKYKDHKKLQDNVFKILSTALENEELAACDVIQYGLREIFGEPAAKEYEHNLLGISRSSPTSGSSETQSMSGSIEFVLEFSTPVHHHLNDSNLPNHLMDYALHSEVEVHEMSYTPSFQSRSTEDSHVQRTKILNGRGSKSATNTEAESQLGHSRNSSDSAAELNTAKELNSWSPTENEKHKLSSALGPRRSTSNPSNPSKPRNLPTKLEPITESHDPQRSQLSDSRKWSMSQLQSVEDRGLRDTKIDELHDAVRPVINSVFQRCAVHMKEPEIQNNEQNASQNPLQDSILTVDSENDEFEDDEKAMEWESKGGDQLVSTLEPQESTMKEQGHFTKDGDTKQETA